MRYFRAVLVAPRIGERGLKFDPLICFMVEIINVAPRIGERGLKLLYNVTYQLYI